MKGGLETDGTEVDRLELGVEFVILGGVVVETSGEEVLRVVKVDGVKLEDVNLDRGKEVEDVKG